MPKLWTDTIDAHRREVRDAILEATAQLAIERGVSAVTMSDVAEKTGIGRPTLYKYFGDVGSILAAWHEQQVQRHLDLLSGLKSRPGKPLDRLTQVLETYAQIQHAHRGHTLAPLFHRGPEQAEAERALTGFVRDLIDEAVTAKQVRDDVPSDELARFCLHALTAASEVSTKNALRRLVEVTIAGICR